MSEEDKLIREPFTSSDDSESGNPPKRLRSSIPSNRKRQRVRSSPPIEAHHSPLKVSSTLSPVTVKTWIQVASDVETYRRLVEAGVKTSSTLANEFQRMFIEYKYCTRLHKLKEFGTKLHRKKLGVGKRNLFRRKKTKRKYDREVLEVRHKESTCDHGSAQLKFWVMEVLSGDAMQRLAVTHWALRNPAYSGLFNGKESQRLESVDESIAPTHAEDAHLLQRKYRPLTFGEEAIITRTLRLPESRIVQTRFGINMNVRLLKCLCPGEWLNDEVVNFWLGLVQERCNKRVSSTKYPPKHRAKVLIMNSFFWTRLFNKGSYTYKNVRRWTKKTKLKKIGLGTIFELDKLLIPVHISNTHWCGGVINFKQKRFEYYDSLGRGNNKFFKFCRRYLHDECRDKLGIDFCLKGFENFCPSNAPQQGNGSDCGMFMLKFLEWASECRDPSGPDGFSQEHMRYFRRRTLLEIIQNNLIEE